MRNQLILSFMATQCNLQISAFKKGEVQWRYKKAVLGEVSSSFGLINIARQQYGVTVAGLMKMKISFY